MRGSISSPCLSVVVVREARAEENYVVTLERRTKNVLGEKGRRIRELTAVVQKRFNFPEGTVELFAQRVNNRALSATAQAESLRYKLEGGLAVRRACYGVLRFVMENEAKGCEIVISGKLRAQRAKAMKFRDGYMLKCGHVVNDCVDTAVRHVQLRQGVLGIKVSIMLPFGVKNKGQVQPDLIKVIEPKDEESLARGSINPHGRPSAEYQRQQQEEARSQEGQRPFHGDDL